MIKSLKPVLLFLQLIGFCLSLWLLLLTTAQPDRVKSQVQAFAVSKVETYAEQTWSGLSSPPLSGDRSAKLSSIESLIRADEAATGATRDRIVSQLVALSLSEKCAPNCDAVATFAEWADRTYIAKLATLEVGHQTLRDVIASRYEQILQSLLEDLKRFALVNVVVFGLLLALTLWRNMLGPKLALFSVALTGYVFWASYGYAVGQNWALSILFQYWAAPAYQFSILTVSLFLADLLFWRGRAARFLIDLASGLFPG